MHQEPTMKFSLSASAAIVQERDFGTFLAGIGALPTMDSRQFQFSDFAETNFRQNVKNKDKRAVFSKVFYKNNLLLYKY